MCVFLDILREWSNPLSTLVAAFAGAWAAFVFERRHRKDETELAQLGAANRALYALFSYWNALEQYRKDVIEPYRGKDDAWLNMAATPPSQQALAALDSGGLSFLLGTAHTNTYATLMLQEQRFLAALQLIDQRSSVVLGEVFPRMAGAGIRPRSQSDEHSIEQIIGIDTVHKLKQLTASIVSFVDQDLRSFRDAHDELRVALASIFPKRKTIHVEFESTAQAGANPPA